MTSSAQLAKHLREVHFGGNWTWSNLKEVLSDVSRTEAVYKIDGFNTIAGLAFHINYYVRTLIDVLEGKELVSHDKFSFDVPDFASEEAWREFVRHILEQGEQLATLIERLPEEKLYQTMVAEKYGSYFRNLLGMIEHTHYHLGQIALLKKMLRLKPRL